MLLTFSLYSLTRDGGGTDFWSRIFSFRTLRFGKFLQKYNRINCDLNNGHVPSFQIMKHLLIWLWALVGLTFVSGVVSQLLDPDLSYSKIIRAYCTYVKEERFYRQHRLKDNCMLNVQIYNKGKQVK